MKIIRYLMLLIVVVIALGFFAFDTIVKKVMTNVGSKSLMTNVEIVNVESSFADRSLLITEIAIKNPTGFKSPNVLKIASFKLKISNEISKELVVIDNLEFSGIVATLEQNSSGVNIQILIDKLASNDNSTTDDKVASIKYIKPNDKITNIIIKKFSIIASKVIIDTQFLKEEIAFPNIELKNIQANSENIAKVLMKTLLDEVQKVVKKQGINILEDKLKKSLMREVSERIGLKGNTLDGAKNQIKEKANELKNQLQDKLKNIFKF